MHRIAPYSRTSDQLIAATSASNVSLRSLVGLNAANFFIAEIGGVVMPFLNDFLKRNWRYDAIGIATAVAGWEFWCRKHPLAFSWIGCADGGQCLRQRRCSWGSATACCPSCPQTGG